MDNLESDLFSLIDAVKVLSKKREIRVGDLNAIARQAEDVRGSFSFAKRLANEVSLESTKSFERLQQKEEELENMKRTNELEVTKLKATLKEIEELNSKLQLHIDQIDKENKELNKLNAELNHNLDVASESLSMVKDELQKSYLTCASYEEQIIRLNEQLSSETIERQTRTEFYEKKIGELSNRVNIMEEGMYDPEAYYCLERDRVRVI